ncbi:MAG: 3'-5' exonuclease [Flavobacteriaceae bacterium]|nr:MAG: 3'-5' exonuclease [Flavobacteriaceae bacterium]
MSIENIPLSKILFLDIETVPIKEHWEDLDDEFQKLWDKKTEFQRKDEFSPEEFYYQRGGILAEFGKIVCISCAMIDKNQKIRLNSFWGEDERKILEDFNQMLLEDYFKSNAVVLCAHNGKEFDFPYLCRRMIIQRIPLPSILKIHGKKPWEIPHLDTLELWKFGDYKHYTSVSLLTKVLDIPTPKDDIDGSEVARVFYQEKNCGRIKEYCEKDVVAVVQIFLRLTGRDLLKSPL